MPEGESWAGDIYFVAAGVKRWSASPSSRPNEYFNMLEQVALPFYYLHRGELRLQRQKKKKKKKKSATRIFL